MAEIVAEIAAVTALFLVVAAGAIDAVRYEIPDAVSIAVVVLAAVFGVLTPGFGWASHAGAVAVMFAFGLLAFSRGWLGGGDVKLMSAIAGWTGLMQLPLMFVAVSVSGGVLALVYAVGRRVRSRGGAAVQATALPYAVAIAIGTLWWLAATGGGPLAR
ncbi:MAG: prepilin peptidase [Sphingomonadaceae bacterium]|nr:prepilin peptidase [Sphingomonadaceae bacterium]